MRQSYTDANCARTPLVRSHCSVRCAYRHVQHWHVSHPQPYLRSTSTLTPTALTLALALAHYTCKQAYKAFLSEADRIATTPEEQLSTTLLVLPDAFTEFVDFAAFTEWLEDELDADEVTFCFN
jgi:Protein of unknown function (DUF1415)